MVWLWFSSSNPAVIMYRHQFSFTVLEPSSIILHFLRTIIQVTRRFELMSSIKINQLRQSCIWIYYLLIFQTRINIFLYRFRPKLTKKQIYHIYLLNVIWDWNTFQCIPKELRMCHALIISYWLLDYIAKCYGYRMWRHEVVHVVLWHTHYWKWNILNISKFFLLI